MTKSNKFQMRCDDVFVSNLDWLSKELGVSKSESVEIAVNLFPTLVEMYAKLEQMVKDTKANL
jgi:enolase